MTPQSTIPEEIRNKVPCKCCRIRHDNDDVYRVYKYNSIKLPSGKWSSNYGYLIGKTLLDSGFIPSKRYLKEMKQEGLVEYSDEITNVGFGDYVLLSRYRSKGNRSFDCQR